MARRGRGNRFELCLPIVVCMHSDFGFTYEDISKAFGCTSGTLKKRLREIGYKSERKASSASGRNAGNVARNKREQEECYRRFLEYWDEYGYSDKFEFLGGRTSSKGKVKIRCKLCGCEFERFGNFAQKHSNLRCANCWIHLNDETKAPRDYQLTKHVAESYKSGMSVVEVAEYYGLQERVASRLINEAGVKPNCQHGERRKQQHQKSVERRELTENAKRIEQGFNELGSDINQWRRTLRAIREIQSAKRTKQRLDSVDREIDAMEVYEPKIATCKHCGKEWLFWPSREYYGRRNPSPYCSSKCLNRYYKTGTIGDRLRRLGRADEYRDVIPLDEVIERDNGICYLCGCETDKEDSWHDANGYFVCGDTYPTRDHVIPIAKGGTHTWDNVRLACHKCNSIKNDRLLEEYAHDLG